MIDLTDYRCPGTGCPDRSQCNRFRPGKHETAPMTSLYVRRVEFQSRCDQFIEKRKEVMHLGAK